MGSGGGAGGNTGGKLASDVGAGDASEIATSGESGTGAGGTIRSGTGTSADAGAGDGEMRSTGLSDNAWSEGRVVVDGGRAESATPGVARSGDSV
jgi:hypothetical protein